MIYFLGGGHMATAIIAGLCQSNEKPPIFVCDPQEEKRHMLTKRYGVATGQTLPPLKDADILILAVKPQDMANACADIRHSGALVLSIAAGIGIETLSRLLGGTRRIVRVMPNLPAQVGLGVSALFTTAETTSADRQRAEAIMASCGMTLWLHDEAQMHAITGISGSGPAYVFYLLDALQQAATALGFAPQEAKSLSLQTFRGAVTLAEQSGEDFQRLQDNVTSKGGTTFAALQRFRADDLAGLLQQGVRAAAERSREMENA